jgi:hypothetical protein
VCYLSSQSNSGKTVSCHTNSGVTYSRNTKRSPASVKIGGPVLDAWSAPDGSCLFVTVSNSGNDGRQVLAHHWTSFGSKDHGFNPTELSSESSSHAITSFESRGRIHLLSLHPDTRSISSTTLEVKHKATEFSFKHKQSMSQTKNSKTTSNSLVDCHFEVWTKFPVLPAVARNTLSCVGRERRSITFASSVNLGGIKGYFTQMISTFEQTTRKPTDGLLFATAVEWSPEAPNTLAQHIPGSYFQFGSFIVELLCLIPIQ